MMLILIHSKLRVGCGGVAILLAFGGDVVGIEWKGGGDSAAETLKRRRKSYVIGLLKNNTEYKRGRLPFGIGLSLCIGLLLCPRRRFYMVPASPQTPQTAHYVESSLTGGDCGPEVE